MEARIRCGWGLAAMVVCLCMLFGTQPAEAKGVSGYYRFPTVHKDVVVFSAEGDLWRASLKGGLARRLTRHAGPEAMAQFSPNGKWIAFSAYYGGDMDVYIIPAEGGAPKRLTYRSGPEFVVGWTRDSKNVVFSSLRVSPNRFWRLFQVSLHGKGQPQRLPVGYGSRLSFSPDGKNVAFTRYSRERRNWKRYLGGWAQDIWVGSLQNRTYKKITTFPGTDAFPMWHKKRIYFLSDRTGKRNLFSIDPNTRKIWQHTFHKDWDVRWPAMGGDTIVYQRGADLWKLDLNTQKTSIIKIVLPTDVVRKQSRLVSVARFMDGFDLGPKGKRLLINARGDLLNVPVDKSQLAIRITRSSGKREKFASFSHDGKSVVAMSDRSGEDEVVMFDALGEKPHKTITKFGKAWNFAPVLSPNQKYVTFADKNLKLWLASVKTGTLTEIAASKVWEIREYRWSPDSRYIAYVTYEPNRFRSIFLYDTKKKKTIRATNAWSDDYSPSWSPDGKRLYFFSRRSIKPFIGSIDFTDMVDKSTRVYALILAKKSRAPFAPKEPLLQRRNKAERKAAKKAAAKAKKAAAKAKKAAAKVKKSAAKVKKAEGKVRKVAAKAKKKAKKKVRVRVDEEGLLERAYALPKIPGGHYYLLTALKDRVYWISRPTFKMSMRRSYAWIKQLKLHVYLLKKKKLITVGRGVLGYSVSANRKRIALLRRSYFRVMSTRATREPKGRRGLVSLARMRMKVHPAAEWKQIFLEAWRLQRDFFWAPNMAGVKWGDVRTRYLSILDRVLTRDELNDLIGEMIAELGTSHTYVWGGDRQRFSYASNGVLGADLEADSKSGLYRIKKIYRGAPWSLEWSSPLAAHHLKLRKGTYILAIDGQPLKASDNYFKFLQNKGGRLISLTVNHKPTRKGARRIVVKTISWYQAKMLRYVDWVEGRRKEALRLSKGKVAYIHLPNMSGAGLISFYKMWYPQIHKKAMVIDVRGNGGGFVSQMIIQKLMRKIWAFFKPRNTPLSNPVPSRTFHGHVVVVTNATAGSDGDIFCKSFQFNKLGPVIGTRTWGGVVGIRGNKPFLDKGMTTQPEFAWWSPIANLGWSLENSGVSPDIEVDNTPTDVERGVDKQLQTAVSYLLRQLKKDPKKLPALPKYPNKSVKAFRKRMKKWQAPPAPRK